MSINLSYYYPFIQISFHEGLVAVKARKICIKIYINDSWVSDYGNFFLILWCYYLFNSVLHLVAILLNAYYMPGIQILLNPCHPTIDKTDMIPSLVKLSLHFVKNHLKYFKGSSNNCSLCFLTDFFSDFYSVVPWTLNTRSPLLIYF